MTGFAIAVGTDDFDRVVIEGSSERPVLVDFWAPWCAPCRTLAPMLDKLASELADRFTLAKVNTDEEPGVAQRFGIRGIPNCKLFVDGRVVDEFTGVLPEPQLRDFLLGALPSPARSWVASAKARMAAGDAEGALVDLDRALAVDPASEDGALTRIEALLERDRLADAAGVATALDSRPVRDEARLAALKARLAFGSRVGVDIDELGRRAAATPDDCAAKIDYAKALAARGDYDRALESLLAVVRIDRRFGDDAARKTMLAIFEALGPDSDLARRYRRELASAINR